MVIVCVFWSCTVYMATPLHPSNFQGLDRYYICVLWSFWGHDVLRDMLNTFLCFNTWGTNLARVLYVHLIQHNHYCWVSTWPIHVLVMTCQFGLTCWNIILLEYILTYHIIYQNIFYMKWMEYIWNIHSYTCS